MTLGAFIFAAMVMLALMASAYAVGAYDAKEAIAARMTSSEREKFGLKDIRELD